MFKLTLLCLQTVASVRKEFCLNSRRLFDTSANAAQEKLALQDKNYSFYSPLVQDHGPLQSSYASLPILLT